MYFHKTIISTPYDEKKEESIFDIFFYFSDCMKNISKILCHTLELKSDDFFEIINFNVSKKTEKALKKNFPEKKFDFNMS
jgi:hypothetical protein